MQCLHGYFFVDFSRLLGAIQPGVLTLPDCRNLLASAREYKDGLLLPYTVLSLFAGLRPAEIARLTWDRIDLAEGTITLDGSMAKTRQRPHREAAGERGGGLLPFAVKRRDHPRRAHEEMDRVGGLLGGGFRLREPQRVHQGRAGDGGQRCPRRFVRSFQRPHREAAGERGGGHGRASARAVSANWNSRAWRTLIPSQDATRSR